LRLCAAGHDFQPAFFGFITLHGIAIQHRRFAALLDQHSLVDVPAAREIIHGRVVFRISKYDDRIQIAGLHKGIKI
jgi:hypothetical protein